MRNYCLMSAVGSFYTNFGVNFSLTKINIPHDSHLNVINFKILNILTKDR